MEKSYPPAKSLIENYGFPLERSESVHKLSVDAECDIFINSRSKGRYFFKEAVKKRNLAKPNAIPISSNMMLEFQNKHGRGIFDNFLQAGDFGKRQAYRKRNRRDISSVSSGVDEDNQTILPAPSTENPIEAASSDQNIAGEIDQKPPYEDSELGAGDKEEILRFCQQHCNDIDKSSQKTILDLEKMIGTNAERNPAFFKAGHVQVFEEALNSVKPIKTALKLNLEKTIRKLKSIVSQSGVRPPP